MSSNTKVTKPLIVYIANSHPISLNNWQDEHYFISSFLILFFYKVDGHLAKCKTVILSQT